MPKKTHSRMRRLAGPGAPSTPRPRQTHPAPRPTAAVPIESAPQVEQSAAQSAPRPVSVARPASAIRANRPSRATSTLISDYGYVSRDLTRIAILAALAFAVLVGLTFVVH